MKTVFALLAAGIALSVSASVASAASNAVTTQRGNANMGSIGQAASALASASASIDQTGNANHGQIAQNRIDYAEALVEQDGGNNARLRQNDAGNLDASARQCGSANRIEVLQHDPAWAAPALRKSADSIRQRPIKTASPLPNSVSSNSASATAQRENSLRPAGPSWRSRKTARAIAPTAPNPAARI
ncbi:hypothetical protein BN2497_13851 [Janthinobacterium sp. CG23_2]|nr:hypothetical protein BN2497_13851 [Janthinobacterium sp. CG23_2]CUU33323.1 hypothetical protein BN3177_13851 [Janthinobacterium sp. CG23_2]